MQKNDPRQLRSEPGIGLSPLSKAVAIGILILACLHCTRSIFFDNVSWVNLRMYSEGTERAPFQQRVGMIPLMRFAESSKPIQKLAAMFDREDRHNLGKEAPDAYETMSPEKFISLATAVLCNLLAIGILYSYTKPLRALRWVAPALFVLILYVSYAARYEEAVWYPYDLPHCLLFGTACLAILEGPIWLLFPLFALDIPMRETSIFLVLVSAPRLIELWGKKAGLATSVAMLTVWAGIRYLILMRYLHNPSEASPRLVGNIKNLLTPVHWPQMATLLGFLIIPVWLGRSTLPKRYRVFLWAMVPCLAVTALFGIWVESRIAIEWSMPIALFATIEFLYLVRNSDDLDRGLQHYAAPGEMLAAPMGLNRDDAVVSHSGVN